MQNERGLSFLLGVERSSLACCPAHVREGSLTTRQARMLHDLFLEDVASGVWTLLPVSRRHPRERRGEAPPAPTDLLRAGDALHLTTTAMAGFTEVWSSDRHLLAAARAFSLRGRSA